MTEEELKIIELICKLQGFSIHPANEFLGLVVTDTIDKNRASFYWEEKEGIEEFISQFAQFHYERGYDKAARW